MIVNANSIVQHVIQFRNGIMKLASVSIKVIMSAKKITCRILAHVIEKMVGF